MCTNVVQCTHVAPGSPLNFFFRPMFTTRRPLLLKCVPDKNQRKVNLLWLVHKGVVGGLSPDKKISVLLYVHAMAYKFTSETFTVRGAVTETAPNTFTETTINTNLDSLSREILVVLRADLDVATPDGVPGTFTQVAMSLANEAQTGIININNNDCIASAQHAIVSGAPGDSVAFSESMPEAANLSDTPLYLVASDDLFLGIAGLNNVNAKSGFMVLHCRRAKADAGTYAAILTSQFS